MGDNNKNLLAELGRRGVYQAVGLYVAIAWGTIEILLAASDRLGWPAWLGDGALILHANPGHTLQLSDTANSTLATDLGLTQSATSSPLTGLSLQPRMVAQTTALQEGQQTIARPHQKAAIEIRKIVDATPVIKHHCLRPPC